MTIQDAIDQVNELKPNQVDDGQKVKWLEDLDRRIFVEIIQKHTGDGLPEDEPEDYADKDPDTYALLVPAPFDMIYRWYLEMQIDLANMEMDKYNNSAALYNNAWEEYARHVNREYMPVGRGKTWKF